MNKARFFVKSSGQRPLCIVLAFVFLVTALLWAASPSYGGEADKRRIVQKVGRDFIETGTEHYHKGFYKAAEQSLLRAREYQDYLTASERKRLNNLLERTKEQVVEKWVM